MALHDHSGKYVLVTMAADVEVAWYLFYGERADQSTPVIFGKGLFSDLVLSHLVRLSEEFEVSALNSFALSVETILFNGTLELGEGYRCWGDGRA